MNKFLIVFLAVCLFSVVSAHAFVKRDAPNTADLTAQLNAKKEQITKFGKEVGKQIADAVNPEAHAFVKRDAPNTADLTAQLNAKKEQITKFGNEVGKQIADAVNPEAHTFVKRDAPNTADLTAQLNAMKEQLTKFGKEVGKQIADAVNPEVIKKNVDEFIDATSKTLQSLKPPTDDKPAA